MIKNVSLRRIPLLLLCATVCFAQPDWHTATTIPGVDLGGLTTAQRQVALNLLRTEVCNCGCNYKLAECRMVDPQCAYSRRFADLIVKMAAAGKSSKEIHAAVMRLATEPPPLLSDPVKLDIAGDPIRGLATAKITIVEFSDFQ